MSREHKYFSVGNGNIIDSYGWMRGTGIKGSSRKGEERVLWKRLLEETAKIMGHLRVLWKPDILETY